MFTTVNMIIGDVEEEPVRVTRAAKSVKEKNSDAPLVEKAAAKSAGRPQKRPTIAPALTAKGNEIAAQKNKSAKVSPKKHENAAKPVKTAVKGKSSPKKRKAA